MQRTARFFPTTLEKVEAPRPPVRAPMARLRATSSLEAVPVLVRHRAKRPTCKRAKKKEGWGVKEEEKEEEEEEEEQE